MEAVSLTIFAVVCVLAWFTLRTDGGWYWVLRKRFVLSDRILREDALKYFARCEIEAEPASLRGVAGSLGIGALFGHDVAAEGPALVTIVNSTITGQIQTSSICRSEPLQSTSGADFVLSNVTVNDVSNVVLALDFCTPDEGTFTLRNTIVQQCHATLTSQGYNFVQPEGCVILGDLTGVVVGDDPLLGSLKDNGGPTFTRLPVAVSLAVDGGNPATPGSGGFACEPFDQRGVARLLGLFCDIGAVEEW